MLQPKCSVDLQGTVFVWRLRIERPATQLITSSYNMQPCGNQPQGLSVLPQDFEHEPSKPQLLTRSFQVWSKSPCGPWLGTPELLVRLRTGKQLRRQHDVKLLLHYGVGLRGKVVKRLQAQGQRRLWQSARKHRPYPRHVEAGQWGTRYRHTGSSKYEEDCRKHKADPNRNVDRSNRSVPATPHRQRTRVLCCRSHLCARGVVWTLSKR